MQASLEERSLKIEVELTNQASKVQLLKERILKDLIQAKPFNLLLLLLITSNTQLLMKRLMSQKEIEAIN